MKSFLIDHIDPLGQGVFKENDQIYFIPKTLPGEKGLCKVVKKKKGVHFCDLVSIETKSPNRIEPECPHFSSCNGCHFQHTHKTNEDQFKLESYKRLLKTLGWEGLEITQILSKDRYHYRNRVQLHYDLKKEKIGFHKAHSHEIAPIKNCLLATNSIQTKIKELTENNLWLEFAKLQSKPSGHLELYDINEKVSVEWNQNYAHKGFSQVNNSVNEQLQNTIGDIFSHKNKNILDLFGGSGNLTKKIQAKLIVSVDVDTQKEKGMSLDLFQTDALENFLQKRSEHFDTFIIDPPRAGFQHLSQWTEHFKPTQILYVSCHPNTMVRDLKTIVDQYTPAKVFYIDFFPGTYHFEAAILLNRRVN